MSEPTIEDRLEWLIKDNANKTIQIIELQQELEALRNPWISVDDRLPEVGEAVIAGCWSRGTIMFAKYFKDGFTVYPENAVTLWMPAPKLPPTEEAEQ